MKLVKLIEDDDIDEDPLKALDATEGDTLQWIDNNDGTSPTIVKAKEAEL